MNKGKLIIWALSLAFAAYPGVAGAQPDSETARAQLAAASANAIASLKDGIRNEHIRSDLTVGQFIEQTDASAALDQVLESAEQIGGPRWIDNQTCQLRLEISGPKLSAALVAIAADRGARSPIPAPQLQQILNEWQKRSFGAVGTSIAADKATRLKPSVAGSHWARVTDDAREQGIARARQNAADHILESIRPIELTAGGQTVGDLLAQDSVKQAVQGWLASRPVTQVTFRDDLEVEVTESIPSDELLQTILDAAKQTTPATTLPADDDSMQRLKQEFSKRLTDVVGRASVPVPVAQEHQAIELPAQPPRWIAQPIDAEGIADRGPSPLRTKSAAETLATENLRARILALPLNRDGLTIRDAAERDPRVTEAVNRAMVRARILQTQYRADGSFLVRMTINPRDVWDELRRSMGQ